MDCYQHEVSAKGICINCGKALCADCMQLSDSGKIFCSAVCINSITQAENVMRQLSSKAKGTSMASAYGSYLLGLIFIVFAFIFNFGALNAFLGVAGLGMVVMGIFYHKNAVNNSSASFS